MIKESNFSSSFFSFLLSSFQKEKKRQLLSGMQERLTWSQPGNDRHLCLCCCTSSRMLIEGLSAILRKRKDSKKERKNKYKEQKKTQRPKEKNSKQTGRKKEKMHVLRAGQFRRQRCRSCQAFLTFLAVLVGPEPILRRQPECCWDSFILVSTGSSRATVSRSTRCAAQVDRLSASELRRFTWPVAQLFFRKKNPLVNRKIQEPPEREKFLQEEATGELERVAKDERASLFSTLLSVRTRSQAGLDAPSLTQTLIIQSVYFDPRLSQTLQKKGLQYQRLWHCSTVFLWRGSATRIGNFLQQLCVGKIMTATRQDRWKRHFLDLAWVAKLF